MNRLGSGSRLPIALGCQENHRNIDDLSEQRRPFDAVALACQLHIEDGEIRMRVLSQTEGVVHGSSNANYLYTNEAEHLANRHRDERIILYDQNLWGLRLGIQHLVPP